MSGLWVLLIIILISSLPVIAVYVWFRAAKYQFSLIQFLFALMAGATALFPAFVLQRLLDFSFSAGGRIVLFYEFFIRIAFTEELSRLLMLLIFFWLNKRFAQGSLTNTSGYSPDNPQAIKSIDVNPLSVNSIKKATAIGLVAGLGFSLLENAVYAASDFNVLPLRIITAAVHGACGSRIGAAAVMLRSNPLQAILRILTATAIHGIYNLMITMPGLSPIAAILIAISALVTAILTIRGGWSEDTANTVFTEKHNSGNAAPLFPKRELDKNGENS